MWSSRIQGAFLWLAALAIVVTMAPPTIASSAHENERSYAPIGRAAQAASQALAVADQATSREVALASLAASQPVTASEGVPATAPVTPSAVAATAGAPAAEAAAPPVLAMTADPIQVEPGGVVTYSVAITNVAGVALAQVVLSDTLPAGVVYVAQSAVGFDYSPRDKRLTWGVAGLAPGQAVRGGFQVRPQGLALGAQITNTVSATSATAPVVTASALVEVAPPRQNQVWATPGEGAWLRSEDGRVDLRMPPGAVRARTRISYAPHPDPAYPQNRQPWLAGSEDRQAGVASLPAGVHAPFSLEAVDEQGQPVHQFDAPLRIALAFAPPARDPLVASEPGLATLDEATGRWQPIPVTVDHRRGVVQAELDHFSLFAGTTETYLVERMSNIRGAQTNLFSLAIGYPYPFALPPGRGGLTPHLGLSFSSASYTAVSGHYSLAGFGWQFAGADSIYLTPGRVNNGRATLSLQGATYSLVKVDNTTWFAKENPFLKIAVANFTVEPTAPPATWVITTPDGVRYTFDVLNASQPGAVASYYWTNCGASNQHKRYVRIPLTSIDDPHGNSVTYSWSTENYPTNPAGCPASGGFTRFVRLSTLSYNGGAVQATMRYEPREDLLGDYPDITWRLYPDSRLTQVDVQVKDMGTGPLRTVRSYVLGQQSTYANVNYAYAWEKPLNLHDLWEKDPSGASLPVTRLNYTHNKFVHGGGQDDYGAMTSVSNGYGGSVTFTSANRDGADTPRIVSQRTENPGISGLAAATWTYSGSNWDTAASDADKAAGFATVTVTRPDSTVEEHDFWQSELASNGERIDHRAGREKEVRILAAAGGSQLARTVSTWNHSTLNLPISGYGSMAEHLKPRFVWQEAEETYQNGQPLLRREFSYQPLRQGPPNNLTQYGNLTEVREIPRAGPAWGTPLRSTYTWYYPNTTAWIVDKPARRELYTGCSGAGCSGSLVNQTFFYYDDATADGQHETPPVQGLLRRQKTGLAPLWSGASYEYWLTGARRNGNLRTTTDALNHTTETVYDSAFQAYPVCVKNAKGQATQTRFFGVPGSGTQQVASNSPCYDTPAGSAAWQASGSAWVYVPGRFFGQVHEERDPNYATGNDTAVSTTYDGWGRPISVTRPGDANGPTVRLTYTNYASATAPFSVLQEQRDTPSSASPDYLKRWTFYDGLGQPVQTQAEAADPSQVIVASTKFTGLGQVERQDVAYFDPTASQPAGVFRLPNWAAPRLGTQTAYDALGRVVRVTNPDGSAVRSYTTFLNTTANPYPMTAVVDPLNHQTIQELDALGRLASVKQFTGVYPGAPGWTDLAYAQSRYAYDVADRLVDVWDPDNNSTHVVYDALGRKTSMTDPDMGTWTYAYDPGGNLTRQTDARNQRLCFYYDELNRLKGKTYSTGSAACPSDPGYAGYAVKHYYDLDENGGAVANGIGRRTVMIDPSGSTRWLYDTRGRVTTETRLIGGAGGGTFQTQWTSYDALDRVRTAVYPDGESVTFTFSAQGQPKTVTGSATAYLSDAAFNARQQPTCYRYSQVRQTRLTYRETSDLRLSNISTGATAAGATGSCSEASGNGLQNITYTYDLAGNVQTILDSNAGPQTQTFTYDALDRLTRGYTTGGGSGTYDETTTYQDARGGKTGNLGSKTGVGSYTYGAQAADCPEGALSKPHAVVAGGASYLAYCYDQNGNLRRRKVGTASTTTFTYDAENRLTGVGGPATASFVYDGDGNRVKAIFGATTTVYVGNLYESTGGVVKKYYYAGDRRIALRDNGVLSYLLPDHLGGTHITASGANGAEVGRLLYKPWGETRLTTGSTPTSWRFTGQREDATIALYFYGARYYDPLLGRFVQPDTIVPQPGDPQSLNRFSYSLNNPVRYTDPSGHAAEATGDIADLYAWARLLDQTPSDKFRGWLHERDSARAAYLIAQHEGAPPEVLEAAASSLEAKQTALLTNGYQGVAVAQQSAFESSGVDVGSGMIGLAGGMTQLGGAVLLYRRGPDTDMNLTPRPGTDTTPGGGLSFYDSPEGLRLQKGDKYLAVDTAKLSELQAINDNNSPGHWTIGPESYDALVEWAATRGTGVAHRFTEELRRAIRFTVRWP